eukprot:TRINITY_DN1629_c0_g1_i2.p1 TRINITY_DN1629_c0_g1~~TRINITY_DN1629_c0_g1_i2.p1  ORF type:complete len:659 (+),score=62.24 TRINITY_DN1629_c0_g1_i2:1151-3127(+)
MYSNDPAATACIPCQEGYYQNQQGSSTCIICPQNTYANDTGMSTCQPCPRGMLSSPGSTNCSNCPRGTGGSAGMCSPCSPGSYGDGSTCIACPQGTYNSQIGQSQCTSCPPGTFSSQAADSASQCQACPPGTYAPQAKGFCYQCPQNWYGDLPAQSSCTPCPLGTYNLAAGATNASQCLPCPPGWYSNTGGGGCSACPTGYFSGQGQSQCSPCPVGQFANGTSMSSCFNCTPGTFARELGQSACTPCKAGTYNTQYQSQGCTRCDNATTSAPGSTACHACPKGQLYNNTLSDCVVCPLASQLSECQLDEALMSGSEPAGSSTAYIIGGAVAAGVLLLAIIVLLALLLLKKRKATPSPAVSPAVEMGLTRHYSSINLSLQSRPATVHLSKLMSDNKITCDIPWKQLEGVSSENIIGEGAFGTVYKAKYQGKSVAVKDVKNDGSVEETDLIKFISEAQLMQRLPAHPNVVTLIGLVAVPFCIVTEYLPHGDLMTLLESTSVKITQQLAWLRDIARGMAHLAEQGIIHRDLASRNILLDSNNVAKVSDFGLSSIMPTTKAVYSKGEVGPLMWMSPEALVKKRYSEKSDVWSFGITCIEIFNRGDVWGDMDSVQVVAAVVSERRTPAFPKNIPSLVTPIILSCFAFQPEDRPTFLELCHKLD